MARDRKAHPDEKGTERVTLRPYRGFSGRHRKAHPDEKGTERAAESIIATAESGIARPIPMKRELKV